MSSTRADDRHKLPQKIQKLLQDVAERQHLEDYTVSLAAGAGEGDNYMSDIVKVRLEGKSLSIPLVIKNMPASAHELTQLRRDNYFRTELAMYSQVIATMRQLHNEKLPGERFLGVADFYAGFNDSTGAALALQDMTVDGYRVTDRCEGMDEAHCLLVVRELGRLHALSLALKDQRPVQFEQLAELVREEVFVREVLRDYLKGMAKHAERALLQTHSEDSVYVQRFRDSVPQLVSSLLDMVSRQAAEPYVVIGHGDCWATNYIFKYADDGVTPVAVCMVDLQISRCSSPLNDLAYFLSAAPACGVRKNSYKHLATQYYSSLSEHLQRLGSDPQRLFPLDAFHDHERRFSKMGLCLTLMYTHVFVAPTGLVVDVERMLKHPEQLGENLLNQRWAQRITDIVVHMVDNNFI